MTLVTIRIDWTLDISVCCDLIKRVKWESYDKASHFYNQTEEIWLIIYIIGSDTEEANPQPLRTSGSDSNISQSILGTPPLTVEGDNNNNEDYEKQADEILDEIWRIYQDDNSWYEEAKSKDGLDTVVSKTFPKYGKIFRLIVSK